MGALGGAVSGVIIGTLTYGWLCFFIALFVIALGFWAVRVK
jgi:hypothetical protein